MKRVIKYGVLMRLGILMVMLCCFTIESYAQSNLETRLSSINENNQGHRNEKLFVQTDRDFYSVGDTILVKAFLFPKPSPKIADGDSRFIYVDLVNGNGQVMNREKIIIDSITATFSGYIRLYDNVTSGEYELQAYTYWMQNKGKEGFFTKKIFITDPSTPNMASQTSNNHDSDLTMDFYPEGGSLIHGQKQKVAFKINGYSELEKLSGHVEDQNGNIVATIKPDKYGLGVFTFIADCENSYNAKIEKSNGKVISFVLPKALKSNAIALSISSNPDSTIEYQVHHTKDINIDDKYILVYNSNHFLGLINAKERGLFYTDSTITDGILYFAIIDNTGNIHSNRAYFVKSNKTVPELTMHRADNSLILTTNQESLNANIAVSIAPLEYVLEETIQNGIYSYLTLKSELDCKIPNPEYYLSNCAKLNDLLITQGGKFKSLDELESKIENFNLSGFTKENDMVLEGYIVNKKGKVMTNNIVKRSGQLIRNGVVSLFGEDYMIYFIYPDNNGYFKRGEIYWDNETRFYSEYETYAGDRDIYLKLNEPKFLNKFDYSYLAKQNTRPKVNKHSDEWTDSQVRTRETHRVYGADMYMSTPGTPGGPLTSSYNNPQQSLHTTSKYAVKASKSYIRVKNRPSMRRLIEYAPQKIRNVSYDKEKTLYWNGNVTIDKKNMLMVSIPENIKGKQGYAVIVNGITPEGTPIHHTWIVER